MGFKLHWGSPKFPTKVEAHSGTTYMGRKDGTFERVGVRHLIQHPVGRWYGLSYKSDWFLGIMLFTERKDVRSSSDA